MTRFARSTSVDLHLPDPSENAASNGDAGPDRDVEALRQEIFGLRREIRHHPLIALAEGMLVERYRLTGPDAALGLLRTVSREYGVTVRALAGAFVKAPRPAHGRTWFPGREPLPQPDITFREPVGGPRITPSSLLQTVLDAAAECTGSDHCNVQLSDPVSGALVLEAQRGFSRDFVDFFAVINDTTSACAAALRDGSRVTVTEVATDPVYDDASRRTMLAAGSRSVQSTPLMAPTGRTVGVYSTHDAHPGRTYSPAEAGALDDIARQTGAWLDWHQHTVVLDALEHLHQRAAMC